MINLNFLARWYWVLLLILAIGVRLAFWPTHFAHYDDVGVANSITQARLHSDEKLRGLVRFIESKDNPNPRGITYSSLRWLNRHGALPALFSLYPYLVVPLSWTYAPLQFVLTATLIHPGQSYRTQLEWGRLPSLLAGLALLLLATFVFPRFIYGPRGEARLYGLIFFGFCWQQIIYSVQMSNYMLGVLFAFGILLLVKDLSGPEPEFWKRATRGIAFLILAAWGHYLCLFFAPGFFVALAYLARQGAASKKAAIFLRGAGLAAGYTLGVLVLYHFFLRRVVGWGLNWNVGINHQYEFIWQGGRNGLQNAGEAFCFLLRGFYAMIEVNFAFTEGHPALTKALTLLFATFQATGLFFLLIHKRRAQRALGLFCLVTFLVWGLAALLGRISLSPTRHSLILHPLFVLLVTTGIMTLREKARLRFHVLGTGFARAMIPGLCLMLFLFSLVPAYQSRRDVVAPAALAAELRRFGASCLLTYQFTQSGLALVSDLDGIPVENYEVYRSEEIEGRILKSQTPVGLLSQRMPLPSNPRFRVLYAKELRSSTEVDFLDLTRNGTNELFFYIVVATP